MTRRRAASPVGRGHAWRMLRDEAIAAHLRRFGWWCPGWGRPAHGADDLTLDHELPIARGGLSTRANLGSVLCRSCNARKSDIVIDPEQLPLFGRAAT